MLSVVLLIICVQYCMTVVCSSLDYWCTILYIHTILYTYNQENYRQHSYNIVHLYSREKQTTFIQYCTPIIKRTPKTTFIQYCTPMFKRTTKTTLNVVFVVILIIGVQYCMNVVCSSLDYRCTILYECCL
jgi:hypothetical protein